MVHYCRPAVLRGRHVRLELLEEAHVPDLAAAAQDDELWRWMPASRPRDDQEMLALVQAARDEWSRGERLPFAIVAQANGRAIGSTSYLDIAPAHRALEIGWTWLARAWWRTACNTEAKLLLLRHAFDKLEVNRVALRTDHRNDRSQVAIARIGGVREGSLRQHRLRPDGTFRDTVYFSILAEEWPQVERRLVERVAAEQP